MLKAYILCYGYEIGRYGRDSMPGKKNGEQDTPQEEKLSLIETYSELVEKLEEKFSEAKSTDIRNSVLRWIGYSLGQLENSTKEDAIDIALQAMATLEAYFNVMSSRAAKYRSNNSTTTASTNSRYSRSGRYSRR